MYISPTATAIRPFIYSYALFYKCMTMAQNNGVVDDLSLVLSKKYSDKVCIILLSIPSVIPFPGIL